MESNFWTLPEGQKRMLVAQTSERVGLPPQAVEKDWWVTMTLKACSNRRAGISSPSRVGRR